MSMSSLVVGVSQNYLNWKTKPTPCDTLRFPQSYQHISYFLDKKAFEEAAKRLKLDAENQEKLIPRLRIESRRKYLEKRKEDKVQELEADILDDEYLFADEE